VGWFFVMADPSTFAIVTTTEDPLSAERLVEVLRKSEIDAFARARGAASSSGFEAAEAGYWELFVPSASLEKAAALVTAELEAIEREGEENAAAAEEEAMSAPNPVEE
jgi:hypothetical protein